MQPAGAGAQGHLLIIKIHAENVGRRHQLTVMPRGLKRALRRAVQSRTIQRGVARPFRDRNIENFAFRGQIDLN